MTHFTPLNRSHPYNEAGAAAVDADRDRLARALRAARRMDHTASVMGWCDVPHELANACKSHASYVGWPVRRRPNGRHT